jgi:hypothetical protein
LRQILPMSGQTPKNTHACYSEREHTSKHRDLQIELSFSRWESAGQTS